MEPSPKLSTVIEAAPDNGRDYEDNIPEPYTHYLGRIAYKDGYRAGVYWTSGDHYSGEWHDNLRHGRGVHTYKSGNRYEGEWKFGKKNGHGTFWIKSGKYYTRKYRGSWKDNQYGVSVHHFTLRKLQHCRPQGASTGLQRGNPVHFSSYPRQCHGYPPGQLKRCSELHTPCVFTDCRLGRLLVAGKWVFLWIRGREVQRAVGEREAARDGHTNVPRLERQRRGLPQVLRQLGAREARGAGSPHHGKRKCVSRRMEERLEGRDGRALFQGQAIRVRRALARRHRCVWSLQPDFEPRPGGDSVRDGPER